MTIEPICYVCGVEMPCIDGLCPECHTNEFFSPGVAFAATFGAISIGELDRSGREDVHVDEVYGAEAPDAWDRRDPDPVGIVLCPVCGENVPYTSGLCEACLRDRGLLDA